MQQLPICIKCGAPTGLIGGHFVKGCNCERSAQGAPGGFNPFERAKIMQSDNEVPNDIVYNTLKEIVAMECTDDKGNLDSFGKFPFAQAIRLLAKRDDVSIIVERGPIIKAQWK